MSGVIRSVNVAVPDAAPRAKAHLTGIDKRSVVSLEVFAPDGGYGAGSGVVGDHVGDSEHHGGVDKAVYAFAREELDYWQGELERDLADGGFGENLTTVGIDLELMMINQRLRVGSALLEVSVPRSPCQTFQRHIGVAGWVKRFTTHGRCGVYLRVIEPGTIRAGDAIDLVGSPHHDIDMLTAFAAAMGDNDAATAVVEAGCLPAMYQERLEMRLARARSELRGHMLRDARQAAARARSTA